MNFEMLDSDMLNKLRSLSVEADIQLFFNNFLNDK